MRILQIAPPWESVPPAAYGGTEAVVHLLCEELVRRGHDVTLCASGDSRTSARLQWCVPHSLRTAPGSHDKEPYVIAHAGFALADAGRYDIIHNHAGEEVMALAHLAGDVPMLTTVHCNVAGSRQLVWEMYERHYATVSWSQKRTMPHFARPRFAGVAYNGIDVESFPFEAEKDDYLLFLSRVSQEKGVHIAIDVAKRTGRRLIIAGKVDDRDFNYFTSVVAPQIDGRQITFFGEADACQKRELYRKASCLVLPIVWDEPFGLVMAEALACGTPVVAFNRGAAPEIVRHERTGFIANDVEEMVDAVGRAAEIDPRECREWVKNFDGAPMADRYLEMYKEILSGGVRPAPGPEPLPVEGEPLTSGRVA